MKHREHTYSYLMRALILQFLGNEAHFTSLINYQAYSENAPEGQAHHMFLRFMNLRIYDLFFFLFFYKDEVLCSEKKTRCTILTTIKINL